MDQAVLDAVQAWAQSHPDPDKALIASGPATYSARGLAEGYERGDTLATHLLDGAVASHGIDTVLAAFTVPSS